MKFYIDTERLNEMLDYYRADNFSSACAELYSTLTDDEKAVWHKMRKANEYAYSPDIDEMELVYVGDELVYAN